MSDNKYNDVDGLKREGGSLNLSQNFKAAAQKFPTFITRSVRIDEDAGSLLLVLDVTADIASLALLEAVISSHPPVPK